MTYWERLCRSARTINSDISSYKERIYPKRINEIHIHYVSEQPKYTIYGSSEARAFLSKYSSFAEVQKFPELSGTIDHISCVEVIRRSGGVDYFTREEFSQDGCLSDLEKLITERPNNT
jgi:hypothetical protein